MTVVTIIRFGAHRCRSRFERSETAAFLPVSSSHRQQTYLSSALSTTTRAMIGVSSHSQAQDASRHCLFAQTALIESALL